MKIAILIIVSDRDERNWDTGGNTYGVLCIEVGLVTSVGGGLGVRSAIERLQGKGCCARNIWTERFQKSGQVSLIGELLEEPGNTEFVGGLCCWRGGYPIQCL